MVIHDLKHPTESMISQLGVLQKQLEEHVIKLEIMTKAPTEPSPNSVHIQEQPVNKSNPFRLKARVMESISQSQNGDLEQSNSLVISNGAEP
jgi:hypothetical protein